MPTLAEDQISKLIAPYVGESALPDGLIPQLSAYLDLLVKWNARTNLTAIRDPEEMVRRHFGESLFAGFEIQKRVAAGVTLMDFGSGAGFPGLPIQLLLPEVRVTLAESQGKKASFLREAVRTLGLRTEVWGERVESMPSTRTFDVVALRAVDNMGEALASAKLKVAPGGRLVVLAGEAKAAAENIPMPGLTRSWVSFQQV